MSGRRDSDVAALLETACLLKDLQQQHTQPSAQALSTHNNSAECIVTPDTAITAKTGRRQRRRRVGTASAPKDLQQQPTHPIAQALATHHFSAHSIGHRQRRQRGEYRVHCTGTCTALHNTAWHCTALVHACNDNTYVMRAFRL